MRALIALIATTAACATSRGRGPVRPSIERVVLHADGRAYVERRGAPAAIATAAGWHPRYRAVLEPEDTIELEAYGLVENRTSEPWPSVALAVTLSPGPVPFFEAGALLADERGVHATHTNPLGDESLVDPPALGARADRATMRAFADLAVARRGAVVLTQFARGDAPIAARQTQEARLRDALIDAGVPVAQIHTRIVGGARADWLHAEVVPRTGGALRGADGVTVPVTTAMAAGAQGSAVLAHTMTSGTRVLVHDPAIPALEHAALVALRFANTTGLALAPGPINIYAPDRFLGEGALGRVAAGGVALVPYTRDSRITVTATPAVEDADHRRRVTTMTLTSRFGAPTTLYLIHRAEPGWSLAATPGPPEPIDGAVLIPIALTAGETRVEIVETPSAEELSP
ncbi:MAG: DUF4139 domain-containing protein [Deltaproteobacteria bacterium]|nr:DUF4139 domain-containing protein [Deltaproteobacteria bacterium]